MSQFTITIQGWGKDDRDRVGEEITQIDLTIRKRIICDKRYENIDEFRLSQYLPNMTLPSMFCASSNLGNGVGTCYGDSGGPAIIRLKSVFIQSNFKQVYRVLMLKQKESPKNFK